MKLNLCCDWYVRYEELECGVESAGEITDRCDGWLKTDIPCDIREVLLKYKMINDPLAGLNCFESEWVEKKSWWFKKSFNVSKDIPEGDTTELVLESLDFGADIFLNGKHIGRQMSSFFPFRIDVGKFLAEGENIILVRLTTGVERVEPENMKPYVLVSQEERRPGRGDKRRAFLRKPQYSFGWDWSPRVATCGIVMGAWLESHTKAIIRNAHVFVKSLEPQVILGITLEVENIKIYSTLEADFEIKLDFDNARVSVIKFDYLLKSGLNYIDCEMEVRDAKLWWPNGMGDQPLYDMSVHMTADGVDNSFDTIRFGIRTISLDMSKLREGERLFSFKINGKSFFCKGANWIPADAVYTAVTDEKYECLVKEAREANFNMLRIWGGGLYERDVFYNACDKYGILLWHDFMFACSEYPDDQEWFMKESEKEADYQTKRLANHPSIAIWSGNNENNWGFDEWGYKGYYGHRIYNYLAPAAVRKNCPEIPYWNGSPYGGEHPNGEKAGDRHHWNDCMMNPDMQKRIVPEEYDKVTAKFVSEYGYVGPLKRSSIEKYLDGAPLDIDGEVWQHHNNTFEKDTVLAGIKYHYLDTEKLDMDCYLLYAGLCQGLMYEYSLDALRFKPECSGALFWMYNDCWGETGWTIIDYYLVRKISYYYVKRAFAPVRLIMREQNSRIKVMGCNDTPYRKVFCAEYGYIYFDGNVKSTKTVELSLEPYSRGVVLDFALQDFGKNMGTYFVKAPESPEVHTAALRLLPFRELDIPASKVYIKSSGFKDSNMVITVASDSYAHAVHFRLADDIKLSDEYFDLLPGECRDIIIYDMKGKLDIEEIKVYSVN